MPHATCERALRSPLCRLAEMLATLAGLGRLRATGAALGARELERRLTCCWTLALALVAIGVVAGTAVTIRIVVAQRDHAALVNEASSQRARSQRLAAFLPVLASADPIEAELARHEVARIADKMEAVFRDLVLGEGSAASRSPEFHTHIFEGPHALAPRLARFLAELRAVLRDLEEDVPADPESIAALREEALGPLLGLFDEAVTLLEAHARAGIDRLALASLAIGAVLLLLLLAIGLGIFRPMTRGLGAFVAELARLAEQDPLTGVANRRALVADLERAIAAGRPLAAVAIDLDHFKEANETAGHAGGDALLKAAAARLRAAVRGDDLVGRIGGDEFVVFLLDVRTEPELQPIVERIRAALHEPVPLDGRLLPLGATLGFAICPDDASDPELLLRLADEALVRAKRERRGSVGRARREDALAIEVARDLRAVLDRAGPDPPPEGLAALLQPVLALHADGAGPVLGFEALTRWTHPRHGPIAPNLLFGAAADRESAVRLGRFARRAALVTFAALRPHLPRAVRLAVNLAPAEVFAEGLEEDILADLAAAGVPPDELCLEITEEVLLDRVSDRRLAGLAALRAHGVALALDDFGTGSSGLARLLRLPIDLVKIDRCFVRAIETDLRAREIVRATVALAGHLGMRVVAEGVETEAQARILASLGCDGAQGFFFGRPMGLVELRTWLETRAPTPTPASGSSHGPLGRPEHALDPDDPVQSSGQMGGFGGAHLGELEVDHELVTGHALAVAALGHEPLVREDFEHARQG
ncbi:MAG: hypothetical protein KatS3mg117_2812 [Geminicoccaceae bacterium]|jgi:diguanylate cyclase (GGDEF)-like protein|nr:MAG: hypothetical protein KatS3mg117_2812 [Geminicoccaceae bacterium]